MCQFGNESKIIEELELSIQEALIGYRGFYGTNPFRNEEKFLKSLNVNFLWPKKKVCEGNPTRINSEGIYNYYNNNNYNYYYYYYNIVVKTLLYGKIFRYKEGYRSSLCIPTHLVILDEIWFQNPKKIENAEKFAEHFNNYIIELAKEYNCETITFEEYSK